MYRRNGVYLSIFAALGFMVLSGLAFAQQKTLKDQIVGSWSIVSVFDLYEDGKKEVTFGPGVKGIFHFDASGHYTWVIIGEKQASMKSDDPRRPDALIVAQLGKFTVEGSVISMHIERSANSARDGADQTLTVAGSGELLSFTASPRKDQKGTFIPHIDVVRVK